MAILHLVWWTAMAHLPLPPPAMPTHHLVNRMGSTRVLLLLLLQLATWAITIQPPQQVDSFTFVVGTLIEVHELVFQRTYFFSFCWLTFYRHSNLFYDAIFLPWVLLCSRNVPPWGWLHGPTSSISRATSKLGRTTPELDTNSTTFRFAPPQHLCVPLFMSVSLHPSDVICLFLSLILNHIESCLNPPKKGCIADVSSDARQN